MIKSMTGFAKAENSLGKFTVAIEIRSYNSRYLDIVLRIPTGHFVFEDKIKGLLAERIMRGRIEIAVHIKENSEEALAFEINEPAAAAYHAALSDLKKMFKLKSNISLDNLLGAGGIIKPAETEKETEECWRVLKNCLQEAVDDLDNMRTREGNFIARDFRTRLDLIETCIHQIEQEADNLLPYCQERLKDRISALTEGMVEIDLGRIAQEAAILADRSDISEEIIRSKSHIEQFRKIMNSEDAAGRKLNFLLQELHREFNTMGAKAAKASVSHMIVDLKSEIEKIREQMQNVE